MSGGSYDYIYCRVREASEYAQDDEISELLYDLADLLRDEEWWQSADKSKDEYLRSLKAFKEKWFKSSREDVAPVIHARWETLEAKVANTNRIIEKISYCSNCRNRAILKNNKYMLTEYCPNCGAKMDKGECIMDNGIATKREEALFQMCKQCVKWTTCHGSGCEPWRVLKETLASYDRIVYLIDQELGGINNGD